MRRSRPPAPAEADVMGEEVMYVRDYTSYDDMVETLGDLVNTYPAIIDRWLPDNSSSLTSSVSRYSVGQSTEGRQIWGVRITGDVRHGPPLLMPSVKLVANIHGDEKVGRELLIGLAR